jgi:miniconductance mechanosensitive channel
MERIQIWVEQLVTACGITGDAINAITHTALVIVAFLLAGVSGWICRKALIPVILKVTAKTEAKWDDALFNERVLKAACSIVPAIVIWLVLPWTFYDFPTVREVLTRLTAIYITVMSTRTLIVFIDSLMLLENSPRSARRQYLYSICGVLKIIIIFIAIIVVIAIVVDKDPSTLFAGLGAASAILMLAFQDTIKGLVAGIRLTNNDMIHIGDWITLNAAGINGRVEHISLTTVKVRNFDNTIVTVTPQTLVDGSFQNWLGMEQNEGRKQTRKVYFDFRSIRLDDDGVANITKFRQHVEQWLCENPKVIAEKNPLVRQAEASQAGCCLEFTFWLYAQAWADFEHDTADIMEYIFAASSEYGLTIYQQFPSQQS